LGAVIVLEVSQEDAPQVPFSKDDDVIEAQNARSVSFSLGRLVLGFRMVSCCRKARFSSASPRCGDLRLDRMVASKAYSK
jgi:hypothetical protein